jgi:hypothetical protein
VSERNEVVVDLILAFPLVFLPFIIGRIALLMPRSLIASLLGIIALTRYSRPQSKLPIAVMHAPSHLQATTNHVVVASSQPASQSASQDRTLAQCK